MWKGQNSLCHGMAILLLVHCSLLLMLLVTGNSMYCTLSGICTGPLPMESSTPHPKTTRDDVPGPSGEWSIMHFSMCIQVLIILLSIEILIIMYILCPCRCCN